MFLHRYFALVVEGTLSITCGPLRRAAQPGLARRSRAEQRQLGVTQLLSLQIHLNVHSSYVAHALL
jgi:hypothetical protein